ncbi:hypothetical protein CTAYLR_005322 [Chrysophaeum taylorii]|uniref:Splicing factor 3A subunit 1 n=1 Tax=Chrysophaeum taylorii TaxID=2483200 RepID=A0AAD7U7P6_9STRA|nr:hypothetical protein CTAYLR_005322 [Chrysophaeum taylorii]
MSGLAVDMMAQGDEAIAAPRSGEVTGLIKPPPDIRAIVDKTAQFVARNGKSFESRILASQEGQSQKFSFMKPTDPYYGYYEFKIRECEENGGELKAVQPVAPFAEQKQQVAEDVVSARPSVVERKAGLTAPIARALKGVDTTAPPKPLASVPSHPTAISPLDSEIIKLTAQYTAASGRQFLAGLAQREQRNPQFDFLKPTHVLFSYFTALVDAYTKVLAPSAELREELEKCTLEEHCLRRATHRWDWSRRADEAKRREKAQQDAERVAFQSVDWHDFVVVEVIDFPKDEMVGAPPPPPGVAGDEMQTDLAPPPPPLLPTAVPPPPPALPRDDDIKIVSDYAPRVASAAERQGPKTMIDPLTGNEVPIDRMSEHMRIQLLDPRWREEQKRLAERGDTTNSLAAGEQIAHSLSAFARQRNDIFGSTEDEQAALLDENRLVKSKPDDEHGRIIWDGHGSSINRVQAKVLGILNQEQQAGPDDAAGRQIPGVAAPTIPGYEPPLEGAPPGLGVAVVQQQPLAPQDASAPPPPSAPAPTSIPPRHRQAFLPPAVPPLQGLLPAHQQPPPPPATTYAAPLMQQQPPETTTATYPPQPQTLGAPSYASPLMQHQQPLAALQQYPGATGIPPPPPPPPPPAIPPPPGRPGLPPSDGEPEPKRLRVDPETGLVSEADFAMLVGDAPQSISVKVPVDDSNPAWGLKGQSVLVECKATETIRNVKERLSPLLGNMPASKQQLKSPTLGFLKDALTLAHFNIKSGSTIDLVVRSRGRR